MDKGTCPPSGRLTFHQYFHVIENLLQVDAVAANHVPPWLQHNVLHALVDSGQHVGAALDAFEHDGNLCCQPVQDFQVMAENLDRQVAARTGQHLRYAHVDGHRETVVDAFEAVHHLADGVLQLVLAVHTPFILWLQHHEHIGLVQAHRVHAEFVGSGTGNHAFDFGNLRQQSALHGQVQLDRGFQVDGRQFFQLYDDVTLVHGWHEGLADPGKGQQRSQ